MAKVNLNDYVRYNFYKTVGKTVSYAYSKWGETKKIRISKTRYNQAFKNAVEKQFDYIQRGNKNTKVHECVLVFKKKK